MLSAIIHHIVPNAAFRRGDARVLIKAGTSGVWLIWKAGLPVLEGRGDDRRSRPPLAASKRALFDGLGRERGSALMDTLDACNRRWGRRAVVPGTGRFGSQRNWSTRFDIRSPRYTTRIADVPVVTAVFAPVHPN